MLSEVIQRFINLRKVAPTTTADVEPVVVIRLGLRWVHRGVN